MKNLKKLVIASFMLVIAFVAVVSSTYAWFTQGTEASVNNITIGVVDAEKSLLISKDGATWNKSLDFNFANKELTPTTIVTNSGAVHHFNQLFLDDNLNAYYYNAVEMEEATVVPANTTLNGYIKFELYFQIGVDDATKWANTTLNMNLNNLNATKDNNTNHLAISSYRLAVAAGNSQKVLSIIESQESNQPGLYNSGSQFALENGWMAIYARNVASIVDTENSRGTSESPLTQGNYTHGPLVATDGKDAVGTEGDDDYQAAVPATKYQLVAVDPIYGSITDGVYTAGDMVTAIDYTTATEENGHFELSLEANDTNLSGSYTSSEDGLIRTYHLTFYVWMEGWDGDCVNAASAVVYTFDLKFKVK